MNGKDLKPEKASLPSKYLIRLKELESVMKLTVPILSSDDNKPFSVRLVSVNGKRIA